MKSYQTSLKGVKIKLMHAFFKGFPKFISTSLTSSTHCFGGYFFIDLLLELLHNYKSIDVPRSRLLVFPLICKDICAAMICIIFIDRKCPGISGEDSNIVISWIFMLGFSYKIVVTILLSNYFSSIV